MIKVALPYVCLLLGWAMFLMGAVGMEAPLWGMFASALLFFGSMTCIAFFIAIAPSLDDYPADMIEYVVGGGLIVAGAVGLGVDGYLFGKDLAHLGHAPALSASWLLAWFGAATAMGVGAGIKLGWTHKRIIPVGLLFGALFVVVPLVRG